MTPQKRFATHRDEDAFYDAWIAQVRAALIAHEMHPTHLASLLGNPTSARLRRRLRGESRFEAYELLRISHGLGISLDPTGTDAPTLELAVADYAHDDFTGEAYLKSIVQLGEEVEAQRKPTNTPIAYLSTGNLPFPALCHYHS